MLLQFPAAAAPVADKVDFNTQIRPLLSSRCYQCHGPDEHSRKAKLRLDLREDAVKDRQGSFAIKPGDTGNSELIRRITAGTDSDDIMPPTKSGDPLKPGEIALLKQWVQQGAPYAVHWAFINPERPALPKVRQRRWVKTPIDHFILAKLEQNKIKPSPLADRYSLIRRVTLDLTGLPPTPAEVEVFVNDKSPKAFDKVVDRLLASPAYGEKWSRMWLDLARYADSYGYGTDSMRQNNPWPYRDWVINAFNRNLPYDEFTLEQLAGDLLADPSDEQLIATAFHRNTMTNVEGGTDDEEWRVAAVKDRVNVTVQAWMGLTMGCAQCHSHKFDPISQKEYYQFYAIFNQTADNDQPDERPTLLVPSAEQRSKMTELKREIAALQESVGKITPALTSEFAAWEKANQASNIWKVVAPLEFNSAQGTSFKKLADGSLLISTNQSEKDTYTVTFHSDFARATAIRLEVFPDESLPGHGPGHGADGRFVLNDLSVSVKPDGNNPARVRFVRIELPGKGRILSLAEVQVFSGGTNVALKGKASQSSIAFEGAPERAIDGNTNGAYEVARSTTHTQTEKNPWWEVDLGEERSVDSIVVWNRTDTGVGDRLAEARVKAFDARRQPVWSTTLAAAPDPSVSLNLDEQNAVLKRATATVMLPGYNVASLAGSNPAKTNGWAVDGSSKQPQSAVFEFANPVPAGQITLRLTQNLGQGATIGRFRVAIGASDQPALATPPKVDSLLAIAAEKRSAVEQEELLRWFARYANCTAEINRQIESRQSQLDAIQPPLLPVMRELAADKRRTTRFLNKGNFLDPGEEVSAAIPLAFNALPAGAPLNRLGVAKWLMSPDNPLTARVTANRFWAQLFGVGLVETEEDFGTQGTPPSHPELLDWLALELRTNGWNVKQFLKTIVLSATYQQSARVTPESLARDPRDRLLSRFPRRRLEAEMVRDQALALSGLLHNKMGGPSVYPPQPDGLWRVAFDGTRSYPTSTGHDRYRRGIYTVWRRTIPYPSMATFDAPSRESCTFRRLPTNTPLQAFVTLNDPVFVEAAQALGRRLVAEGGETIEQRIRFGLNLVQCRPPEKSQIAVLKQLFDSELAHYRGAQSEAMKLATDPLGPLPNNLDAAEGAAWTVVANVLLNLDGVLTKG